MAGSTGGNGEPVEPSWPDLEGWLWAPGPGPGRAARHGDGLAVVELVGGPLDGAFVEASLLTADERAQGLALSCAGCRYPGGRSLYDPVRGRPEVLRWIGDIP
ncbi:hypothetical protein [Kitasatospora sp. NPDC057223]|uniref:hypothetical protein n=1 Tax=Kitasatospora sp. NPDC057223 TaxID=3346055 RepID=UPI003644AEA2